MAVNQVAPRTPIPKRSDCYCAGTEAGALVLLSRCWVQARINKSAPKNAQAGSQHVSPTALVLLNPPARPTSPTQSHNRGPTAPALPAT